MTQFIKPAPGRIVRREGHGYGVIPEEGELVTWSIYYDRLKADGDITVEPIPDDPEKPPKRRGDS